MGKVSRLQFRISQDKKDRAERCAELVGIRITDMGEAAVDALCDYIEAHGELTLPLIVLPKNKAAASGFIPSRYANDPETKPVFSSSSAAPKSAPSLNDPPVKYLPKKKTKPPKKP